MNNMNVEEMQDTVYNLIFDAFNAAGIKFDTDGQNVWIDCKDGKTLCFSVEETCC